MTANPSAQPSSPGDELRGEQIPPQDAPFKLVEAPLKKVRGSRTDEWNHKNPCVDLLVKLTPYRPAFQKNPEEERMLPEVDFSPLEGIPVDEYEEKVILITSSDEEDFDTWREKENLRDALLSQVSETKKSDSAVSTDSTSGTISVCNDRNARLPDSGSSKSTDMSTKTATCSKSPVPSLSDKQRQQSKLYNKTTHNHSKTSTNHSSTIQTSHKNTSNHTKTTASPNHTSLTNHKTKPSLPKLITSLTTTNTTPHKTTPHTNQTTNQTHTTRITHKTTQSHTKPTTKLTHPIQTNYKTLSTHSKISPKDVSNHNNKTYNSKKEGVNAEEAGALLVKHLHKKGSKGHEPIEYFIPKKKSSLRSTAVSSLLEGTPHKTTPHTNRTTNQTHTTQTAHKTTLSPTKPTTKQTLPIQTNDKTTPSDSRISSKDSSNLKKRTREKERLKPTHFSMDKSDNDNNNKNNVSTYYDSSKNEGVNNEEAGALLDKLLCKKGSKGRVGTHEPVEYTIPKKKSSLRSTAVSSLLDENCNTDFITQLTKLHENGPTC